MAGTFYGINKIPAGIKNVLDLPEGSVQPDIQSNGLELQNNGPDGNIKGGTSTKITNNLGKEIDITPSTNHTTTTKNPGLKGTPNSSIDIIDSAGNIKTRRWFGSDGIQIRDVDFTNHGNAKLHPEWPHEHGTR